ncbi:MAG: hypothetical protein KTR31_38250 [Myxococcales bacterium]|nr:hypothetical protein [Myxococcales bacterium]
MLIGVYIVLDDQFSLPVYADPDPDELDEGIWVAACERVNDALESEGPTRGHCAVGDVEVAWRTHLKLGLSFVAIASDVKTRALEKYLRLISERYLDEVDDVREPDRHGVADVMVDVIPPWEDEDQD